MLKAPFHHKAKVPISITPKISKEVMILVIVLAKQYTFVESNEFLNVLVVILIATLIVGFSLVTGFSFIMLKREIKKETKGEIKEEIPNEW